MEDAARRSLERAQEISARIYVEPIFLLYAGCLHARSGDAERAREALQLMRERVQEGNDQDAAALLVLEGEIGLNQGRYDAALQQLEVAHRKAMSNAYFLESLATGHRLAGHPARAIELYRELVGKKRALDWEPQEGWISAHLWLGRLSEQQETPQEPGSITSLSSIYGRMPMRTCRLCGMHAVAWRSSAHECVPGSRQMAAEPGRVAPESYLRASTTTSATGRPAGRPRRLGRPIPARARPQADQGWQVHPRRRAPGPTDPSSAAACARADPAMET